MSREILKSRRAHEIVEFSFWNVDFVVGVGRRASDGAIRELFINSGKTGASMETMSRDCAVLLSIALQHGTPIDTMRKAISRNADGTPQGPIGVLLDMLSDEEQA